MENTVELPEIKHFQPEVETQPEAHIPTLAENIAFVKSRYPDASERKYAKLSMVIWCPMLDCRLSGFFHTFDEAWADAVTWINKHENKKK